VNEWRKDTATLLILNEQFDDGIANYKSFFLTQKDKDAFKN
jgi:hypothetical protein